MNYERRQVSGDASSFVNDSLMNMKIRCQRLVAAEGGHIEEGR